jgi:hypothetical protein
VAKDGGEPNLIDTAVVNVHVNRNNFQPNFETDQYQETLLETQALGVPFVRISARDQDNKRPYNELQYDMLGEPGVILYFMIDKASGDIALKKSLMDDPDRREQYQVSRLWLFIVI